MLLSGYPHCHRNSKVIFGRDGLAKALMSILHSENDLYELLTHSEARPKGSYNHVTWEIRTKGELDSDAALITSVHEAMHDQLNNCTAYGLILIIVAYLTRSKAIDKQNLLKLVNACRTSHEIFATYTSLLIVSRESILQDLIQQDYPSYFKYVQLAQSLMPGVHKKHLQYPIINSLIRVCYQNPFLVQYLRRGELLNLKPTDCPDQRLILLSGYLTEPRLKSWLQTFVETHESPAEARRFVEAENDLDMITEDVMDFDAIGQALSNFVYEAIKTDASVGFPVMEFDAHLDFLDDLLAYANRLAPMGKASMPLVSNKYPEKIDGVSWYESEAVVFNEQLLPATVIPFADFPEEQLHRLLSRAEGKDYFYIISRITERFLTQYQFSESDRNWLSEYYPDFVITIATKQNVDGVISIVFVMLDSPDQFNTLGKKEFPMLTNSSMLLTSDHAWEPWYEIIEHYSTHTLLFDLSPSIHLERSITINIYDKVYYNSFHLEMEQGNYAFIVMICNGPKVAQGLFILPCSAVMSNLLQAKLEKLGERFQLIDPEKNLNEDMQWLLRLQMTRLLDESRFDFKALSSQYALMGFTNDRFHTA
ncbi:MAG: hypothetical protein JZU65_09485 [Chlorobium sp.]|jgi:hypothetical protein|nr:hypothetical protein [Chlorobium sp.]